MIALLLFLCYIFHIILCEVFWVVPFIHMRGKVRFCLVEHCVNTRLSVNTDQYVFVILQVI